jgi:hypothetical protein
MSQLVTGCPSEVGRTREPSRTLSKMEQQARTRITQKRNQKALNFNLINWSKSPNWNHPSHLVTWWFPNFSWHLRKLMEETRSQTDNQSAWWHKKTENNTQSAEVPHFLQHGAPMLAESSSPNQRRKSQNSTKQTKLKFCTHLLKNVYKISTKFELQNIKG